MVVSVASAAFLLGGFLVGGALGVLLYLAARAGLRRLNAWLDRLLLQHAPQPRTPPPPRTQPPVYCLNCGIDLLTNPEAHITVQGIGSPAQDWVECDCGCEQTIPTRLLTRRPTRPKPHPYTWKVS